MAQSRPSNSIRSELRDTAQKKAFIRFTAESDPLMATRMAKAISDDVSLLAGLAHVVKLLCKHKAPRDILGEVFSRPGISKRFSNAYKAYATELLFG